MDLDIQRRMEGGREGAKERRGRKGGSEGKKREEGRK